MNSLEEVRNIPIQSKSERQVDLRNVAEVTQGTVLGEYDRYNMQRMLTLQANIVGERSGRHRGPGIGGARKAGRTAARRERRGARADRADAGNVQRTSAGLIVAVVVIFLLLAANFQSFRLSLAVVLTVPAVVAGVAVALGSRGRR